MASVLVILADGVEEIEAITPIDLLRRAGAEVTTASAGPTLSVTGRSQLSLLADRPLAEVETVDFDCVLIPGGPGVAQLRTDSRVRELARRQAESGRWLAAICAAPLVLHDAGLLAGRHYTAHPSAAGELPDLDADSAVVEDGTIITSRGAGTAFDFALHLIARLFSPEVARRIADSVVYRGSFPS